MHIFLHKRINYGHVTLCAYACSHCLRLRNWNCSRSCSTCSSNTTQSTRLCLTVNSFPKSRLFANINMFKLFDFLKSRPKLGKWRHCVGETAASVCRLRRGPRARHRWRHRYHVTTTDVTWPTTRQVLVLSWLMLTWCWTAYTEHVVLTTLLLLPLLSMTTMKWRHRDTATCHGLQCVRGYYTAAITNTGKQSHWFVTNYSVSQNPPPPRLSFFSFFSTNG